MPGYHGFWDSLGDSIGSMHDGLTGIILDVWGYDADANRYYYKARKAGPYGQTENSDGVYYYGTRVSMGGAYVAGGAATVALFWGALPGTTARISFGHGARHLAGTGLSAAQVECAITQHIGTLGSAAGASWGWVQVNGQWIQYRLQPLADGTINVGTYFLTNGPLSNTR
jgi:hypothetical protein